MPPDHPRKRVAFDQSGRLPQTIILDRTLGTTSVSLILKLRPHVFLKTEIIFLRISPPSTGTKIAGFQWMGSFENAELRNSTNETFSQRRFIWMVTP